MHNYFVHTWYWVKLFSWWSSFQSPICLFCCVGYWGPLSQFFWFAVRPPHSPWFSWGRSFSDTTVACSEYVPRQHTPFHCRTMSQMENLPPNIWDLRHSSLEFCVHLGQRLLWVETVWPCTLGHVAFGTFHLNIRNKISWLVLHLAYPTFEACAGVSF